MINVTKPYLPPFEKYTGYLQRIWERNHLTNQGPVLLSLEERLREHLGVRNLMVVSNGTIAIQLAIKALDLKGEIITTPFSYVATTNSILWENCKPVFVDIRPDTLGIDETKIEAAITKHTVGIMPVHVYGFPCDVDAIQAIGIRHNLKVIYDAAHAFGVMAGGRSILDYGDVSTLSFHATKLFHSIEGGAVIAKDPAVYEKIRRLGTFGHVGDDYYSVGINAKMSEFNAAMGHCVLDDIDSIHRQREAIFKEYDRLLAQTSLQFPRPAPSGDLKPNYAYYPVIFPDELTLLKAISRLNTRGVYPRRYFYPSLNTLPFLTGESCPVAEDISSRILCLPFYPGLSTKDIHGICETVIQTIK